MGMQEDGQGPEALRGGGQKRLVFGTASSWRQRRERTHTRPSSVLVAEVRLHTVPVQHQVVQRRSVRTPDTFQPP
jgi:hypothetical protein